jgi:hypothetical protein
MKYSALLTLAVSWLIFACNNPESSDNKSGSNTANAEKQAVVKINPVKQGLIRQNIS